MMVYVLTDGCNNTWGIFKNKSVAEWEGERDKEKMFVEEYELIEDNVEEWKKKAGIK